MVSPVDSPKTLKPATWLTNARPRRYVVATQPTPSAFLTSHRSRSMESMIICGAGFDQKSIQRRQLPLDQVVMVIWIANQGRVSPKCEHWLALRYNIEPAAPRARPTMQPLHWPGPISTRAVPPMALL